MDCKKADNLITQYAGDAHQPLVLRLHLLTCPGCREKAARLEKAIHHSPEAFFTPAPDFSAAVLARLPQARPVFKPASSYRTWLLVWLTLLISIVLSPFSEPLTWIKESYGVAFKFTLSLVLGLLLTACGALFIATHLKDFSRRFHFNHDEG